MSLVKNRTKKIRVSLRRAEDKSYDVVITDNLVKDILRIIKKMQVAGAIVIITDSVVKKLHGVKLKKQLLRRGLAVQLFSFPAGEKNKNQRVKTRLEEHLSRHSFGRDTLILALGGGVVGDMAGFVAATYLRGVPCIQIPTTLLAMVDSSVGGKTAIDTVYGKNLIGSFWQPRAALIDVNFLKTLPQRERINGLVEALKMFLTSDATSLPLFKQINLKRIKVIIGRAIGIKAQIVSRDEKDRGERAVLNFGHTIGHALEKLSDYQLAHGSAVGLGMLVEAKISELLRILSPADMARIALELAYLGMESNQLKQFRADRIVAATKADKKNKNGATHYVLLKQLGRVVQKGGNYTHPVKSSIVKKAFSLLIQ